MIVSPVGPFYLCPHPRGKNSESPEPRVVFLDPFQDVFTPACNFSLHGLALPSTAARRPESKLAEISAPRRIPRDPKLNAVPRALVKMIVPSSLVKRAE